MADPAPISDEAVPTAVGEPSEPSSTELPSSAPPPAAPATAAIPDPLPDAAAVPSSPAAPAPPQSAKPPSTAKPSRATSRANLAVSRTASRGASKQSLANATSESKLTKAKTATTKSRSKLAPADAPSQPSASLPAASPQPPYDASITTMTSAPAISEDPSVPPPGCMPLFLTSQTQELFKVKGGEDVTTERPFKMIPKADLLSDLHARAAISDFYPAKQAIIDFPGDEVLVHWDQEYRYGQNFWLAITEELRELVLHPPVAELAPGAIDPLAPEVKKKIVSKPWESYGSEREIESDWVVNNRELLNIQVTRRRRHFGGPCKFGDRDAHDGFSECKPYKDATYDITRMELSQAVQAVPELVDGSAQTSWFRSLNFAVQYEPAVMPQHDRDVLMGSNDIEEFLEAVTVRFEKALQQNSTLDIFQDDYQELGEADMALEQGAHTYLQEYQSFTDLMHSKDRCISCVDWHPTIKGVLAISCTERLGFDERVEKGLFLRSRRSLILLWSFSDPIHPQLILEAPEDIQCFRFNPHDPNIIAGGCITGQIVLWDISDYQDKLETSRKSGNGSSDEPLSASASGAAATAAAASAATATSSSTDDDRERVAETPVVPYVAVSSIEQSHRGAITDLEWLPRHMELGHNGEPAENGQNGHRELVTCSTDGQVAFWDTRFKKELKALDLVWRPFLRVPLSAMDNTFDYSLTKVSIKRTQPEKRGEGAEAATSNAAAAAASVPDAGERKTPPTGAAAAAALGAEAFSSMFFCATEEGDLIYADWIAEKASEEKASRVEHAANYHFGAMSDLHRSPFFPDILLSVGGWSFHIWREGVTTGPLLSSAPASSYAICGRWSPTRPGVFYISKYDGSVEVWDLLDRSHSPSSVQNISGTAVSYMSIRQYPGKSLSHNQFIAAGDDEGTLHILEVPRNLTKPGKNEKAFVRSFFDREVRRLGYVKNRKEFRVKERGAFEQAVLEASAAKGVRKEDDATAAAAAAAAAPQTPVAAVAPPPGSARPLSAGRTLRSGSGGANGGVLSTDEEEKAEAEYLKIEKNFLELEGLLPATVE
ncbi:WD repeat-containing protein 63 [Thoreauomyces humboldtii]|nr:WD repeat-containing protein 63 [Thoreauomyces humboldtii]